MKGEATKRNLSDKGVAVQVSTNVLDDINDFCAKHFDDGFRWHLGASLIGHECQRYLFYVYRWCFKEEFDGRMQRLFNRGHREEERFIQYLEGIGFKVFSDDWINWSLYYHAESDSYFVESKNYEPTADGYNDGYDIADVTDNETHRKIAKAMGVKFKQFRISAVNGHFGGSLDGIAYFPERYCIEEPILLEFKTAAAGTKFNTLTVKGMAIGKPMHFAQMSTYGTNPAYGFGWGLYMCANKNNDYIHVEVIKLSQELGQQTIVKATRIILAQEPPPRLSENPTFHKCGYCPAKEICHRGALVNRNCRSCKNAVPDENAEFFCTVHNGIIPRYFVMKTCESYSSINDV